MSSAAGLESADTGTGRGAGGRTAIGGVEWRAALGAVRRLRWITVMLVGVLVLIVCVAIFAPLIAPDSPTATNILEVLQGPSRAHLLGTDSVGRDVLSRIVYGSRSSILAPAIVVAGSSVAGTALSVSAVWIGGLYKLVISRVMDLLFSIPGLLIAILVVAAVGTGQTGPIIALAVAFTPYVARVVQSVAERERSLAYIESGQLAGFGGWSVCIRHLVPNVLPILRAQAPVSYGIALIALAGISFLGLGVQPPRASWGLMVAQGESALLSGHPLPSLAPAAAIVILVVVVNQLADQLESALGQRA